MFKNRREGDYSRLVGVVCLAIFFVSTAFVQAAPPVAIDDEIMVTDPSGTDIELSATGGATSYIITSLPVHGWLFDPGDGLEIIIDDLPYTLINANNVIYEPCPYFVTGAEAFTFKAHNASGDSNIATVSLNITLSETNIFFYEVNPVNVIEYAPLDTYYEKARTQSIYHADELGNIAQTITNLALNIKKAPAIAIQGWKIRMKHTSQTAFSSPYNFDNTGVWTVVYFNTSETMSTGWNDFAFQTPFVYNGTSNLIVDFIFDSSISSPSGYGEVHYSTTGINEYRTIYNDSPDVDPLQFTGSFYRYQELPNLKLQGGLGALPERVYADFNCDYQVDTEDLIKLVDTWLLQQGDENYNADCDISIVVDNKVNLADFAIFASQWLLEI